MYTAMEQPSPESRYQQYQNHVKETLHQESVQNKERSLCTNTEAEPLTNHLQLQLNEWTWFKIRTKDAVRLECTRVRRRTF